MARAGRGRSAARDYEYFGGINLENCDGTAAFFSIIFITCNYFNVLKSWAARCVYMCDSLVDEPSYRYIKK